MSRSEMERECSTLSSGLALKDLALCASGSSTSFAFEDDFAATSKLQATKVMPTQTQPPMAKMVAGSKSFLSGLVLKMQSIVMTLVVRPYQTGARIWALRTGFWALRMTQSPMKYAIMPIMPATKGETTQDRTMPASPFRTPFSGCFHVRHLLPDMAMVIPTTPPTIAWVVERGTAYRDAISRRTEAPIRAPIITALEIPMAPEPTGVPHWLAASFAPIPNDMR